MFWFPKLITIFQLRLLKLDPSLELCSNNSRHGSNSILRISALSYQFLQYLTQNSLSLIKEIHTVHHLQIGSTRQYKNAIWEKYFLLLNEMFTSIWHPVFLQLTLMEILRYLDKNFWRILIQKNKIDTTSKKAFQPTKNVTNVKVQEGPFKIFTGIYSQRSENQNLISLYGGFPIFASKMVEVGKCVSIIISNLQAEVGKSK